MSSTSSTSELFAWEEQTVGDLFDLEGGFAFKSSEFLEDGVPVIKIKNVKSGFFSKHDFSFVSEHFLTARPQKVARQSDLLISMSGNRHDGSPETWVGKVAYFDAPEKYLINQRVGALRVKDARKADPRFFSYLLSSLTYQELFIAIATSSGGQANLSPGQILSAPVYVPKLAEQQRIAYILGTLDDKIELNRRMAATLEEMARALFKSWFVDFDPVHAKAEGRPTNLPPEIDALFPDSFEDSELGPIPTGWEVGKLGDLCRNLRRPAPLSSISPEEPYVGLDAITKRSLALMTWGKGEQVESQKSRFKNGEILFGKLRPYFHKVCIAPVDGVCSTDILVIDSKEPSYYSLVALMLSEVSTIEFVTAASDGTRMPRTKWEDLDRMPLAVPPIQLAENFDARVRPLFDRVKRVSFACQSLGAIRDTLLPKLISGELSTDSHLQEVNHGTN